MDSLQSKLYRICNEFYKNKKLGLVEEIEVNKANATIYSTRHQAVANRKKAKWKLDEIAAWFGHASIETASRHYGRAGRAWGEGGQHAVVQQGARIVQLQLLQVNGGVEREGGQVDLVGGDVEGVL